MAKQLRSKKFRRVIWLLSVVTFVAGFMFLGQDPTAPIGVPAASAAVPELEDYAAAAFVTLALLIGLRVRRSHRPAA